MKWIIVKLILLTAFSSHAIVNMKNANFTDTWEDLTVPGSGYDLKVTRTYNSRTLFNGIFGFGWCSDFETTLNITPEGNIRIKECGGGSELVYSRKNFKYGKVNATIDKIIARLNKDKKLSSAKIKRLKTELAYDDRVRENYAKKFGIKEKAVQGQAYYSQGRKNEKIILKKNHYIRTLPDSTFEKYDLKGRLTYMYDRNGNSIKIGYTKNRLTSITDNNGRKLSLSYKPSIQKVKLITGPNNLRAEYKYKGEDLIYIKNAWKNAYSYKYDELHNLVRINFPDKTFKKLTYDKNKDWVTSFTDREKCLEKYSYRSNAKDKLNHYFSEVKKTCNGKVTNTSKYEFIHKNKADGSNYLYRARSVVNGRVNDTIFDSTFGKPISVLVDKYRTSYKYYKNGQLQTKTEPFRTSSYKYNNKCQKVSEIKASFYRDNNSVSRKTASKKKKKLLKTIVTNFKYENKKCNLVFAKNSTGQTVSLSYDYKGRISRIKDQAKKIVKIKYEERFGKPSIITRPGLGSLKVRYNKSGNIKKNGVKSDQGANVAIQVANIFNNLLEIISPATSDLSI